MKNRTEHIPQILFYWDLNIDRHILFVMGRVHTAALAPQPVWGGHSTHSKADKGVSVRTRMCPYVGGTRMGNCMGIQDKEQSRQPFQPFQPIQEAVQYFPLDYFSTPGRKETVSGNQHSSQIFNIMWTNCIFFLQPSCLESLLKAIQ